MIRVYGEAEESIHLSTFPVSGDCDADILDDVGKVRSVIAQAMKLRNKRDLKVRQPLSVLYLDKGLVSNKMDDFHTQNLVDSPFTEEKRLNDSVTVPKSFETILAYESIIRDELNIKEIVYLDDFDALRYKYLSLNFQIAGRQLKSDLAKVKWLCENLSASENDHLIRKIREGMPVKLNGFDTEIPAACFNILSKDRENIVKSTDNILVAMNIEITPELKAEGIYREILRHCQLLRKEAGFAVADRVTLSFETDSGILRSIVEFYEKDIARETLSEIHHIVLPTMRKDLKLDDGIVNISIA